MCIKRMSFYMEFKLSRIYIILPLAAFILVSFFSSSLATPPAQAQNQGGWVPNGGQCYGNPYCISGYCSAIGICENPPPPTATPTPTSIPTPTPTLNPPTPTPTRIPIPTSTPAPTCPLKSQGDANCDIKIDLLDFNQWKTEFLGTVTTKLADFNSDNAINLLDFNIWKTKFLSSNPTAPTPTGSMSTPTPTSTSDEDRL